MKNIKNLVSPEWLVSHLNDSNVIIIDCRFSLADPELGKQQYQTNHIPGAFYLDLNRDLSSPISKHGGRHPLPNPTELAAKLSAIGVTKETLIVAYDDSKFAFAARLWWLIRYMGSDRVALLDGGFSAWQTAGYPLSNIIPTPQLGNFEPQLKSELVVDIETVKTRKEQPGVVLIDSRESDRYAGIREPIDPVAGHIPNAVNYPWQDVTGEGGKARSTVEQKQRWEQIQSANEIIVYCGSGVTACVNLFSLEIAGISNAKLYAGSWSDWCSYL
ncbi:3-mercaptopyruvate sulfurtransferase [Oscillatoriales cyanobacterium USR001]|nr:3-mercaptopyruvate sulfurtransferase [Oscillatoriales cyanobacterium USR001]